MIRQIIDRGNGRISWRQTFLAFQYPNYRLWFWGQMISLFGTWMQATAQGFLIFELTKSSAYLGYAGFANGIPTWLFMLYAGVVADRRTCRDIMIVTQTAMMILAFISAGLTFFHLIQPWHVLVLSFLFGVANAFDAPARQAIVQELVAFEDMTNAIALNSMMFNTAVALGPAVGGVTYALFGPGWCFLINGLSFIAVIVALALMKIEPVQAKPERNSVWTELKEGVSYVATHPLIRTLILLVGIISLFGISYTTLIPAWAVKMLHGGASLNGLLLSVRGVGSLACALLIASLGRFQFRGKLLTAGSFALPVCMIVFSFVRLVPLSLVLLFLAGFAQILLMNLANAEVQTLTQQGLRGRVMSIYSLTFFGVMPFGALLNGHMATGLGEPATVLVTALITMFFAAAIFFGMPKIHRLQ